MQPNDATIEQAARWFATHGRDGSRAVIPTIRQQYPNLTTLEAIAVAKVAAELEREACHADDCS